MSENEKIDEVIQPKIQPKTIKGLGGYGPVFRTVEKRGHVAMAASDEALKEDWFFRSGTYPDRETAVRAWNKLVEGIEKAYSK